LFLYNSSSQKVVSVLLRQDKRVEYINWTSPTVFSSTPFYIDIGNATTNPIFWMRISQDNVNRNLYLSIDGYHWVKVYSTTMNSFLVPDKIGLGLNAYATRQQQALFVHWSLIYS